jgi:GNAT superfamily N-acetyltransferase
VPPVRLLGYLVMQVNSVTAHISKLAVDPAVHRRGLGTALLQVRWAPQPHPATLLPTFTLHTHTHTDMIAYMPCRSYRE